MPVGGLTTGPRNLLRQIREAMAGASPAQDRLDTVVRIIAQSMVAEG
jgi:phosphotransferase system enzyme I (PtsP)